MPEKPNKKWKRLSKDIEVRLMHAYFIKCNDIIYDKDGNIEEILCTYDPETKSGSGFNERKPNGNIHFVEATTAIPATFNQFAPLLLPETEENKDWDLFDKLNPDSLHVLKGYVEASLASTKPLDKYQFVRNGYYCTDKDSTKDNLIFNCTASLKSSFTL